MSAKLDSIRAAFEAEGWKIVEVAGEAPHDIYSRGYLRPQTREATDEEAAQLAALDAQMEALDAQGNADGEDAAALFAQRNAITASLEAFSEAQKADGGVCAYVGYDGDLVVRHWTVQVARSVKRARMPASMQPV
ncbi:hypothetical protein MBENS4_4606 [Novosphingobium sp. MBES04]|nr:hypothetical protein MBENS4_4606 [Novosphingobium sp. MBES04]